MPTRVTARLPSENGPSIVLAAMPTISVISLFTAIAGWIWRKRQQWGGHFGRSPASAAACPR